MFGGFDGNTGLDDLWCLSLTPPASGDLGGLADSPSLAPRCLRDATHRRYQHYRLASIADSLHQCNGSHLRSFMPLHIRLWRASASFDAMMDVEE